MIEQTTEFISKILKDINQRQEHSIISKKISKAELETTKELENFKKKSDKSPEDFKKIQNNINRKTTEDIKDAFLKNKILNYLEENTEKIFKKNKINSEKEKILQITSNLNDSLSDIEKLAKYGSKDIDEIIQMADFVISGIEDILPQAKQIQENTYKQISKNHFEKLLQNNTETAEEFLKSDFAKKYIKEGYLSEIQIKEQEKLNKIKAEIFKKTELNGLKQRIKQGYSVENQEIYNLSSYIEEKELNALIEENNFIQQVRKMNETELENLKKTIDKNKIPQIEDWISSLNKNLKNDPLKTANRLNIIDLENIDFKDQNSIKKREKDIKIIKQHYNIDDIDSLLQNEKKK